jgi:hypothetical protein
METRQFDRFVSGSAQTQTGTWRAGDRCGVCVCRGAYSCACDGPNKPTCQPNPES